MIVSFDNKYLVDLYKLGTLLHPNYSNLYNEESLNGGVNRVFMYILDNKLIGFIHIQDLFDEVDIIDIIVDPSNRNKGYATKLLKYVFDYAKNKKVILEVSEDNTSALELYKKNNFQEINRRKGYYKGKDAIIMEKK